MRPGAQLPLADPGRSPPQAGRDASPAPTNTELRCHSHDAGHKAEVKLYVRARLFLPTNCAFTVCCIHATLANLPSAGSATWQHGALEHAHVRVLTCLSFVLNFRNGLAIFCPCGTAHVHLADG